MYNLLHLRYLSITGSITSPTYKTIQVQDGYLKKKELQIAYAPVIENVLFLYLGSFFFFLKQTTCQIYVKIIYIKNTNK